MYMPFKNILRRKSKNRRESKVIHAVDESETLSKPFPKLETRVTSPTELINLVGHPVLSTTTTINNNKNIVPAIQRPTLLKTASTANTEQFHDYLIQHRTGVIPKQQHNRTVTFFENNNNNNNSLNDMMNEYNKIDDSLSTTNNIKTDKTLIHPSFPAQSYTITTYSEYSDHKIYNHRLEQQSSPCLKRQYDHDQINVEFQELRLQLELLEKEQEFWQQRIHDHQKRENDLLNLLETTIDKLNQQLIVSTSIDPSDISNDHYHYHYHHYYFPESSSLYSSMINTSLKKKKKPLGRSKSMDHHHYHPTSIQLQNKNITNIIHHNNNDINNNPIYDDYIIPPWRPFVYF